MSPLAVQQSTGAHAAGASRAGRGHARMLGGNAARRAPLARPASPAEPPLVMVFRSRDGRISHARCGHSLEFQGHRARIELDFYCRHCLEHVTVPDCVLPLIPFGEPALPV